ncbi:MAG: NAD(P)/FAD-dependent oxidoreductase [Anaerovoracaceae bacterium]
MHQIKLGLNESKGSIPYKIKKRLDMMGLRITDWKIVKESIDARYKNNIKLVYSVDFECDRELDCSNNDCTPVPEDTFEIPRVVRSGMKPPVVAGFGPCGMFAALVLSLMGLSPIVLERGKRVEEREKDVRRFWESGQLDPESNVQFGEGGAGTFSDGKLTTNIKDIRINKVLEVLAEAGGDEEITWKAKPHIGTDRLKTVVRNIRQRIEENGGTFRFSSRLDGLEIEGGRITAALVRSENGGEERIETDDIILAVGHSARDTFKMLSQSGIQMEQKPFSIGVRIEHPQTLIDRSQYGDSELAKLLGHADYKLSYHCRDGRGVYTFCMCPGGEVICASSEEGGVVTNGMSRRARNGKFANSGLLVDVRTSDFESDDPLAGVEFQRKYEELAFRAGGGDYTLPQTTWGEFADSEVKKCLPDFAGRDIIEAMPHLGKKLRGFDDRRARMTAVETRSSSPVRILRDRDHMMSRVRGLYPAGEGAGYAGGIVSAAVDGIKAAEAVARRDDHSFCSSQREE